MDNRDKNIIALTHVCRAWRQVFVSRSSLWADIDCMNANKTLVYLKRSRSFPINLSLSRVRNLSPHDHFIQTVPHVIGRIKSIYIQGTLENLQGITTHLSHPAPTLEDMSIIGGREFGPEDVPILIPTLFGGDLSSLRKLCLEYVRTELPWRNMVNLTSLRLVNTSPISTDQLLDFLEGAFNLRDVDFCFKTPTSGDQNGRLVSLTHLKRMCIWGRPSPVLLDHLLIPVGVSLTAIVNLPRSPIEDHPPKFLNNLRNLPGFTTVEIFCGPDSQMQFSGPNGEVCLYPSNTYGDGTRFILKSLSLFDASKTEQLKIDFENHPSTYPLHEVLLPMKDLRTLKLCRCASPNVLIHALDPRKRLSGIVICPKLEDLVIEYQGTLDTEEVMKMTAAREARGAKLKFIAFLAVPVPTEVRTRPRPFRMHVGV